MVDFDLQNLVHALSPSEMARVRDFLKKNSHAARMLDDLREAPPCRKEEFLKEANARKREYVPNFPFNKGYLIGRILDAVRSQRQRGGTDKSIHLQVPEQIADAEFLHDKMLYDLCLKRLDKALKTARKYELHEDWAKIIRFKARLLNARQSKGHAEQVGKLYTELRDLGQKIENKYAMLELRSRLFARVRGLPQLRTSAETEAVREIMNDPLLRNVETCLSFDAKLNFHFAHALYYQLDFDLEAAHQHHLEVYRLWKKHPHFKKSRGTDFRNTVNNYLSLCNSVRKFDDFVEALTAMERGPFHSIDEEAEVRQNALFIRMQHFIARGKWDDAAAIEDAFKAGLDFFGHKLIPSRTMAFYMSFARLNLIQGDLKKAMRWNQRILAMDNPTIRQDLRLNALLFSMILYYEMGQTGALANRYRVVMRAFKKANLYGGYERLVNKFLHQLPGIADGQALLEAFSRLEAELLNLGSDPRERHAQGFHFTLRWLGAKVTDRSMKEIGERW